MDPIGCGSKRRKGRWLMRWLVGLGLLVGVQSSGAQVRDVRGLPQFSVDGMVNTRTGGVNVFGSLRVGDGWFLFGGSGDRLKAEQVGTSVEGGVGFGATRGRRLATYLRTGLRGQREWSEAHNAVVWRPRLLTDLGARACAGRVCGSLGFPVVWVKPYLVDLAAGLSIGLR